MRYKDPRQPPADWDPPDHDAGGGWDEDDADDRDAPQSRDLDDDDDDDSVTEPCPNCRRDVYEGTDRCPYCGEYIVPGRSPRGGRGLWVAVVAAAVVVALLYWVLR